MQECKHRQKVQNVSIDKGYIFGHCKFIVLRLAEIALLKHPIG